MAYRYYTFHLDFSLLGFFTMFPTNLRTYFDICEYIYKKSHTLYREMLD